MKLTLNTEQKTIVVGSGENLGELVKNLEKLLPKDSPFGHWKDYKIEVEPVIHYTYPIYPTTYETQLYVNTAPLTYNPTTNSFTGGFDFTNN